MVFLDISILNSEETYTFYCETLNLFEECASRVICKCGTDLILNFCHPGTDRHFQAFKSHSQTPVSFSFCYKKLSFEEVEANKLRLRKTGVLFEEHSSHVAQSIELSDPSGNRLQIIFEN